LKQFGEKEIQAMQSFVSANQSAYHLKYQQNLRQFYWHMGMAAIISLIIALGLVIFFLPSKEDMIAVITIGIPIAMLIFIVVNVWVSAIFFFKNIVNALEIYDSVSLAYSLMDYVQTCIAVTLGIFLSLLIIPLMFMYRLQYVLCGIADGNGLFSSIKKSWAISKEVLLNEIFTGKFVGDIHLARAYIYRFYFPKKI
jgi:hypothetical protein